MAYLCVEIKPKFAIPKMTNGLRYGLAKSLGGFPNAGNAE